MHEVLFAEMKLAIESRVLTRHHSSSGIVTTMPRMDWKTDRQPRLDRRMPPSESLPARRAAGEQVKDLAREYAVSPAAICKAISKGRAST